MNKIHCFTPSVKPVNLPEYTYTATNHKNTSTKLGEISILTRKRTFTTTAVFTHEKTTDIISINPMERIYGIVQFYYDIDSNIDPFQKIHGVVAEEKSNDPKYVI